MSGSARRDEAAVPGWRRRLERFRSLEAGERRVLVAAWLLLPVADGAARLLPLSRLERLFGSRVVSRPAAPLAEESLERIVWLVAAAARHHLYPLRCLPRTLTLRHLLARRGVATELRIGASRPAGGRLAAHAWLEDARGRPLGETPDVGERFPVLEPSSSRRQRGRQRD